MHTMAMMRVAPRPGSIGWILLLVVVISSVAGWDSCSVCSNDTFDCWDAIRDFGVTADDDSPDACQHNTEVLKKALQEDFTTNITHFCLVPPNRTLHVYHGILLTNVTDVVWILDGRLQLQRNWKEDPFRDNLTPADSNPKHSPLPLIQLQGGQNITLTTSAMLDSSTAGDDKGGVRGGMIHGNGAQWWGIPFLGFLALLEQRPMLLIVNNTQDLLVEGLVFQDSPFYHLSMYNVSRVEIREISVISRRTESSSHSLLDLSAFNTDGIDVSGSNVWIHDCDIWVQDDCIAVKDNWMDNRSSDEAPSSFVSSNMTFERIAGSGLGLVIGSIGGSTVRNITFRDSYLHKSFKGIYFKFRIDPPGWWRGETGLVQDILIDNITMEAPQQWPIWIGPAQQAVSRNPCHASPCSLCWPMIPFTECSAVPDAFYRNITLRNVQIHNPLQSPGVLMGAVPGSESSQQDQIDGIFFNNVQVTLDDKPTKSEVDIHALFPGLSYPLQDPYVRYGLEMVLVALLLLIVVLVCLQRMGWFGRFCGGGHPDENGRGNVDYHTVPIANSDEPEMHTTETQTLPSPNSSVIDTPFRDDDGGNESGAPEELPNDEDVDIVELDDHDGLAQGGRQEDEGYPRGGTVLCKIVVLIVWVLLCCLSIFWWKTIKSTHLLTEYYLCEGVRNGIASGNTWPVPHCFQDQTVARDPHHDPVSSMSWTTQACLFALLGISSFMALQVSIHLPQKRQN